MMDLDSRIAVLRQLRTGSDIVRTQLIPTAVAEDFPARQAFFDFIKAYFQDNVLTGQLASASDVMKGGVSDKVDGFYDTSIDELASVPSRRPNAWGFESLHPRYLSGVSAKFFAAIDANRSQRRRGDLNLEFLVVVDFCLKLTHFAKDGTGRVGEDFLVLLAAEAERPLTICPTGYRGTLGGSGLPLVYREVAGRILYHEFVVNFFKFLGMPGPAPISYDTGELLEEIRGLGSWDGKNRLDWPDGLGPAISRIVEDVAEDPGKDTELFQPPNPYRYYADFLAHEMIYFTLCLENPGRHLPSVKSRYPRSFVCYQYCLELALERSYHPVAEGIGATCDEAAALIEAMKMDWPTQDDKRLEAIMAQVEADDAELGLLLRHELSSFLTDQEISAIQFRVPRNFTGAQLDEWVRSLVLNTRADQPPNAGNSTG